MKEAERQEAKRVGVFMKVVTPTTENMVSTVEHVVKKVDQYDTSGSKRLVIVCFMTSRHGSFDNRLIITQQLGGFVGQQSVYR